jgi:hypothetical protein
MPAEILVPLVLAPLLFAVVFALGLTLFALLMNSAKRPLVEAARNRVRPPLGEARRRLRLHIDNTDRLALRSTRFLRGRGIEPRRLCDVRVFVPNSDLETVPPNIAAVLGDLHERGWMIGADTMHLLFHGRGLRAGEALYFALVDDVREPKVVAFVDRLFEGSRRTPGDSGAK